MLVGTFRMMTSWGSSLLVLLLSVQALAVSVSVVVVDTAYIPVSVAAVSPFSAPFASVATCLVPALAAEVFPAVAPASHQGNVSSLRQHRVSPVVLRTFLFLALAVQ